MKREDHIPQGGLDDKNNVIKPNVSLMALIQSSHESKKGPEPEWDVYLT